MKWRRREKGWGMPMAWSRGPEYPRLRVAIGDCAPEMSAAIRDGLQGRGVEDVVICDTTEQLFRALDQKIIDLVLYDYHLLGARFVEVMQKIRRNEIGRNPFVTVVATMRETSLETVRRLIDGGVDDLLRSPAGADRIFRVIDKSIRRRKPFTVAYDYVGPARPMARREAALEAAQVRVPNTLKSRLLERISDDDIEAMVEKAVQNLALRQIRSCGVEIDALAHRVAETYSGADNRLVRDALSKIGTVATDLRHRTAGTPSERVSDLAATLMPIAQRIIAAPAGCAAREVQLLSQLAAAVCRALSADAETQPAIREIADMVGSFTSRTAPGGAGLSAA